MATMAWNGCRWLRLKRTSAHERLYRKERGCPRVCNGWDSDSEGGCDHAFQWLLKKEYKRGIAVCIIIDEVWPQILYTISIVVRPFGACPFFAMMEEWSSGHRAQTQYGPTRPYRTEAYPCHWPTILRQLQRKSSSLDKALYPL